MDTVTNEVRREDFRLSTEQQAEIGDILLSAQAVSRQVIAQAQERADKILQSANERADTLVHEAEEKAAEILRAAEARAQEIAPVEDEPDEVQTPALSEEMQEYVVRCVGDCFAKLRQQQLDTVDYLNEQWRGFLSGLSLLVLAPLSRADDRRSLNFRLCLLSAGAVAFYMLLILGVKHIPRAMSGASTISWIMGRYYYPLILPFLFLLGDSAGNAARRRRSGPCGAASRWVGKALPLLLLLGACASEIDLVTRGMMQW